MADMNPLIDSFGRTHTYLRISVTDRCNLRCMYCMPPKGEGDDGFGHTDGKFSKLSGEFRHLLSFEEILRVARIFVSLGVRKIRLTGGEPLVRRGVVSLVSQLAQLPGIETLGMTTNGVLLAQHAQSLKSAGLTHLNVSLDTLRPERFLMIAKRPDFERVLSGVQAAIDAGFSELKLNVVVMGGVNDDEVQDFAVLARDNPINVRFIEYMPFKFNHWTSASLVPWTEITDRLSGFINWSEAKLREDQHSVAKQYDIDGWKGSIGFITSMSDHFCDTCNRLRLTADGSIKSCLFHPAEINVRDSLRGGGTDDALEMLIRSAVAEKPLGHAPLEELVEIENRSMIEIGG